MFVLKESICKTLTDGALPRTKAPFNEHDGAMGNANCQLLVQLIPLDLDLIEVFHITSTQGKDLLSFLGLVRFGVFFLVFFTFICLVIVISFVSEIGLLKGRQTRIKLISGLLKMYKDQGVEGYYDASLLSNYATRYNLFLFAVVFTGIIAIIVPTVLMI